ncbi:MAG: heat-inducible transcription repressor HrcA [Clostridia bacterium]|nr:heat-inducible transcription repressor HrcA [Bacillota bacterium]PWM15453.1 MAG: heat-inducible transcription repressor HrcA [Clostridia bacterium]PWM15458.1 MAG: heat-inducible transcription repressor HrcA [Clostridia bacterium]
MAISERKKKILAAVVDEYIRTAEPVGSKAIAQSAGLGCSSATIRNELAELVSLGYLEQPHTSAGRVPTPMGYRMYVNELMEKQKLSLEESEEINRRLNARLQQLDDALSNVSRLASQLTDYPALALTAQHTVTVQRFDLIYVDANTFIIVLTLSSSQAKSKLVRLPISVDQKLVQRLSSLFNSGFTGVTEEQISPLLINSTERAADDTMGITSVIAAFVLETLTEANTPSASISGENRLLSQPEFRDPDKAHRLMSYLSGGGYILPPNSGLDAGDGVKVLIGPENVAEELKDSSVVLASYDAGDNTRGLIGVVGPTRMDYSAVAAKLSCLAASLSRRLGGGEAPPEGMHNKLIIKGDDPNDRR